jgi:hypothetical protein
MTLRLVFQFSLIITLVIGSGPLFGQMNFKKNSIADSVKNIDTTKKKERSIASKAALRSAILPGLGQIYNKKYWKLPIVYGLIAIPVSTFQYNSSWYKKTRFAYSVRATKDTANYINIAPELQPISDASLRLYRNEFRKNMDFSVLGLLVMWGLNVVDATVDGHLRKFDISDELSMDIRPTFSSGPGQMGLSANFYFDKKKHAKSIVY